jgi:hypothetical protein
MEVKATQRPAASLCSGLLSFAEIMPGAEFVLVCRVEQPQLFRFGKHTVRALPWLDCLKMICGGHAPKT